MIEFRSYEGLEVRGDTPESRTIGGLAVPFNVWSEDLGFREQFAPGSLDDTLKTGDQRVIFNHDTNMVVGRKSAGTASFEIRKDGLHFTADAPNATWANDMLESIRRRDITQNSFGFMVEREEDVSWEERDGELFRTVHRAILREVGPQPFPAYEQTSVDLRAIAAKGALRLHKTGRYPDVARRRLKMLGILG